MIDLIVLLNIRFTQLGQKNATWFSSQDAIFNEESIVAYTADQEEINTLQRVLEVTSPLLGQTSCLNQLITKRIALWAIAIASFAISTGIASNWAYKTKILDGAMLANGLSIAAICALLLPPEILKSINTKTIHWSYESLFLVTQIFLNLVPKKLKGTIGSI